MKGVAGDEMAGWHHRFNGHESEQAPGDTEGQGTLLCCSPWGGKKLNTTWQLNNSLKNSVYQMPTLYQSLP